MNLGKAEDYLVIPLVDTLYMLKLNTEPAVSLTFYLLPVLQKNSPSYILNISSMAGLAPIPVKNIYNATKSAIIFFSYALRYQLKKQNISVSCLCSGPVFTKPEIEKDTAQKLGWFANKIAIPAKQVGEIAVSKTLKGKMIIVPGIIASVISGFLRLMPRRLIVYIYYKLGSKNN